MAYLNERRVKKIYITDGSSILASNDFFFGPYDSLSAAVTYINNFCDNLGVNVPVGLTITVYKDSNKNSVSEYLLESLDDSGYCKASDFIAKLSIVSGSISCGITYEDFDNGNTSGYINIE